MGPITQLDRYITGLELNFVVHIHCTHGLTDTTHTGKTKISQQ